MGLITAFRGFSHWNGFSCLRTYIFVSLFREGNYSKMGRQSIKNQRRKYPLDKTELSAITTYFFELFSYSERTKKNFFNATFNPARKDTAQCYPIVTISCRLLGRQHREGTQHRQDPWNRLNISCMIIISLCSDQNWRKSTGLLFCVLGCWLIIGAPWQNSLWLSTCDGLAFHPGREVISKPLASLYFRTRDTRREICA